MTQIRRQCPNWTLMTLSLTCPALTGGWPAMPTMSHTIAVRPRKRRLGGEQRRALRLPAITPFGFTQAIMHPHRVTPQIPAKLVRPRPATAPHEDGKAHPAGPIRVTG